MHGNAPHCPIHCPLMKLDVRTDGLVLHLPPEVLGLRVPGSVAGTTVLRRVGQELEEWLLHDE